MLVYRSGAIWSQVCRTGFAGSKVKWSARYLEIVPCQTDHEKIAGRGVLQEPRRASRIMFGVRGRYLAIDDTKRLGLLEKSLLQLIQSDFDDTAPVGVNPNAFSRKFGGIVDNAIEARGERRETAWACEGELGR